MRVTFYKYRFGTRDKQATPFRVSNMTKAELIKVADLKHPNYNKKQFFEKLSTNDDGSLKDEFVILSSLYYLEVEVRKGIN